MLTLLSFSKHHLGSCGCWSQCHLPNGDGEGTHWLMLFMPSSGLVYKVSYSIVLQFYGSCTLATVPLSGVFLDLCSVFVATL